MDAQTAKIAAYCLLHDGALVATYTDAGLSESRADNRPALQGSLEHICHIGGCLVAYSLSGLARSTKDSIVIPKQLSRADADLVSLSEKIDTTTAAGKMVFRLLAVMTEFERDFISERTTTAMQHKKAKGKRVGSIPVGYMLASDGVSLIPNESQQEAIELIRQLRDAGLSMRAIAEELTRRGVPTSKGGTTWKHSTVQRILDRAA